MRAPGIELGESLIAPRRRIEPFCHVHRRWFQERAVTEGARYTSFRNEARNPLGMDICVRITIGLIVIGAAACGTRRRLRLLTCKNCEGLMLLTSHTPNARARRSRGGIRSAQHCAPAIYRQVCLPGSRGLNLWYRPDRRRRKYPGPGR